MMKFIIIEILEFSLENVKIRKTYGVIWRNIVLWLKGMLKWTTIVSVKIDCFFTHTNGWSKAWFYEEEAPFNRVHGMSI